MSQESVVAKIKTVGLDLGDRFSQACGLLEDGTIGVEDKVASRREALRLYFRRFTGLRVVCEVGTHSPWVKPLLESLGHAVLVAKPPSPGDCGRGWSSRVGASRRSDKTQLRWQRPSWTDPHMHRAPESGLTPSANGSLAVGLTSTRTKTTEVVKDGDRA
jgi:hypothetical protein